MSCSRGKASPDKTTTLKLFSNSGGYCQNPKCLTPLFRDTGTKTVHTAEMAHIFAANDDGPRADKEMSPDERGAFENLILLCPTCHTMIDKAPDDFPDQLIREWKRSHIRQIAETFGARSYDNRAEARAVIDANLRENRLIFEKYGPNNEYSENPESEQAATWQNKMMSTILPNNRRILTIMDANRRLLLDGERDVVEAFRQHIADLEARHVNDDPVVDAQRFPDGMKTIFEG